MKKNFFLVSLVSFSALSGAFAQNSTQWLCTADINVRSKVKIEAIVNTNADSTLNVHYKNSFNPDKTDVQEIPLSFVSEGSFENVLGDSCTNQFTGITEHYLNFSEKTKSASYTYSWCDDDGGSGYESYNLTCTQLK